MVSWGISEDLDDFNKWLKENGLYKKYWDKKKDANWGGIRYKYLREKKEEVYQKMKEENRHYDLKEKFVKMLGGKCHGYEGHKCNYNNLKYLCVFHFHHKNPKDKWSKTTSSGYQQNPERFEKDIKAGKIKLLCANCHAIEGFNKRKLHRPWFEFKAF